MTAIDALYQRMNCDMEQRQAAEAQIEGESEVAKFYGGLSVFITGATDLLGKCLLEKMIRSCPELQRIYVLIRVKKGQDFQDKCEKLYADSVFDRLRNAGVDVKSKLSPIQGNLAQDGLGLSAEDRKLITENANMIFHNGGATRLDEQITVALQTNVHGTRRMLELARDCRRLKVFTLVSSAYAHCPERIIEEKFYRAPADLKTVDDMIAADTDTQSGLSRESLRMLLGEWPNVFTFTKATAEDLVQQYAARSNFACCVFRPSVVISSYKEPTPGFCDSKNGPGSFFLKIAMGAVHVVYGVDYPIDLVPADLSANAALVCAWDAADRWQTEPDAFVYNFGTSREKPLYMRQIKDKIMSQPNALVTSKSRRMPYVLFAPCCMMYIMLRVLIDYIPALIIDVFTVLHGNPPEAWSLVRESMGDMCRLLRFSHGNWRLGVSETLKAHERLSPRDRQLFGCDPREIDWAVYFLTYWRGLQAHVLAERPTSPEAETRSRCPCACRRRCCMAGKPWPCRCGCYGILAVIGLAIYYAIIATF